jgi:hypothetical protein
MRNNTDRAASHVNPRLGNDHGGDRMNDQSAVEPAADADLLSDAGIDYDSRPILPLEEMLERFPIEGPVDLKADREAIDDDMAKDVFGERPDRFPPEQ